VTGGLPGGPPVPVRCGIAVLGVGNPDRGDDGVGPAVVAALAALAGRLPGDVRLAVLDGEPSRLVDAWSAAALAVVVDAAAPSPDGAVPAGTVDVIEIDPADQAGLGPPDGAVAQAQGSSGTQGSAGTQGSSGPQRSPGPLVLPEFAVSSHSTGVATAIALGAALDRLPGRLVIVAVTGTRFDLGAAMSEPVRAAVSRAADAVVAAAKRCQ